MLTFHLSHPLFLVLGGFTVFILSELAHYDPEKIEPSWFSKNRYIVVHSEDGEGYTLYPWRFFDYFRNLFKVFALDANLSTDTEKYFTYPRKGGYTVFDCPKCLAFWWSVPLGGYTFYVYQSVLLATLTLFSIMAISYLLSGISEFLTKR